MADSDAAVAQRKKWKDTVVKLGYKPAGVDRWKTLLSDMDIIHQDSEFVSETSEEADAHCAKADKASHECDDILARIKTFDAARLAGSPVDSPAQSKTPMGLAKLLELN
mmetsp:Transcript_20126/g.64037  ORF Transcript_20126/g.64037 Transcript_20126/m.64037 type:complete len:109 (-) Transcript_20126:184-510(-)